MFSCFGGFMLSMSPYSSGLLNWHVRLLWRIWLHALLEYNKNYKQKSTKPGKKICAYFMGYTSFTYPNIFTCCVQNFKRPWCPRKVIKLNHVLTHKIWQFSKQAIQNLNFFFDKSTCLTDTFTCLGHSWIHCVRTCQHMVGLWEGFRLKEMDAGCRESDSHKQMCINEVGTSIWYAIPRMSLVLALY